MTAAFPLILSGVQVRRQGKTVLGPVDLTLCCRWHDDHCRAERIGQNHAAAGDARDRSVSDGGQTWRGKMRRSG